MRKFIFLFSMVFMMGYNTVVFAQDPVFSQFYNVPTNLNPGFTGNFDAPRFAINYRNQWAFIQNAYATYSITYDQYFRKYKSGLGLSLLADSAGDGAMKTTNGSLLYSYGININDQYKVKLGIEAGIIQTRFNWDKFIFYDNLHAQYGSISPGGIPYPSKEVVPNNLSRIEANISTGILLYSSQLYFGVALKHLNNPQVGITDAANNQDVGIPMRVTIHGGGKISLVKKHQNYEGVSLFPSFILTKQGDFLQLNAGVNGQFSQFVAGMYLRHAYSNFDAIILAAGWKYEMYKFVYSYDIPLSEIGFSSGGAHEIGIIINFDKIYPEKSRSIECFEVFR